MNRFDFYLAQLVSESEMDDAFAASEQADWDMMADFGLVGVASGLAAVQHNPTADLTIDISAGVAYDSNGQRIQIGTGQTVDMSVDYLSNSTSVGSPGNSKVISLFLYADRTLSDPRTDGNSNTVQYSRAETFAFKVVQGSEATTGTEVAPALETDKVLVADVTIDNAQTQILNADINANAVGNNRRQDAFAFTAGALEIRAGNPEASDSAILTELNNHITSVSNTHPATAVDYAGGSAWHDATPNTAATLEVQLDKIITDLAGATGSDKVGSAALTAWLGGRARPSGSIQDQLDAVGIDLGATTSTDDGAERVGAEAHTAAGAGLIDLSVGSLRSQLNELSDAAAAHALNQVVAGDWDFQGNLMASGTFGAGADRADHVGVGPTTATGYARRFGRIHEGWSNIREDFLGGSALADFPRWVGTGTANPTIQNDALDGICDLETTAAANSTSVIHTILANHHRNRGFVMEAIVELDVTTSVDFEIGLTTATGVNPANSATTDSAYVRFDTGSSDTTWVLCGNANGSVTTAAATSGPGGGGRARLTLVVATDGSAELYVDGVREATLAAASVGNTTGNMLVKCRQETLTTATRLCELDKIQVWQDTGI